VRDSRPRIFVSSTIYDFGDLRSALKLWLEGFGYDALLSELNDFPQTPDANSYESCLKAIDASDYFILLIGRRVGGWYNQEQRISITQQEYRHAYERSKQGKLRILVFVRQEVWDLGEDRKALSKLLEDGDALDAELSDGDKATLVNHPSRIVNDAEFIFGFLHEVGRVNEMRQASGGTQARPPGNWINRFRSFADIIDSLRTVLDLRGNLRQKALRVSLQHEIPAILAEFLEPHDGCVRPVTFSSECARERYSGQVEDSSSFYGQHLLCLGIFLRHGIRAATCLRVRVLQEAISSGEFLDYDQTAGSLVVGPLQSALLDLDACIAKFLRAAGKEMSDLALTLQTDPRIKGNRDTEIPWPNWQLLGAFAFHDDVTHTVQLCRAIYLHLGGDTSQLARLPPLPTSPLAVEAEQILRERVSLDDVRKWLSAN
jgi:hypothetical protein